MYVCMTIDRRSDLRAVSFPTQKEKQFAQTPEAKWNDIKTTMGPSRNASCAFYHVLNKATYGHEKEQKKYSKTNESTCI